MIVLKHHLIIDKNFTISNKKLNQTQVVHLIKDLDFSGMGVKELSQKYNLVPSTIYNIRNNRDHYLIGKTEERLSKSIMKIINKFTN